MNTRRKYFNDSVRKQMKNLLSDCVAFASDPAATYPNPVSDTAARAFATEIVERAALDWDTYLDIATVLDEFPRKERARRIEQSSFRRAILQGTDALDNVELALLLSERAALHYLHELIDDLVTSEDDADLDLARARGVWTELALKVGRILLEEEGRTEEDARNHWADRLAQLRDQCDNTSVDVHAADPLALELVGALGSRSEAADVPLPDINVPPDAWEPADIAKKCLNGPVRISLHVEKDSGAVSLALSDTLGLPPTAEVELELIAESTVVARSSGLVQPSINLTESGITVDRLHGYLLRVAVSVTSPLSEPAIITCTIAIAS